MGIVVGIVVEIGWVCFLLVLRLGLNFRGEIGEGRMVKELFLRDLRFWM